MQNNITAQQSRDVNSRASLVRVVPKLQCDEIPKSRDAVDQCIGSARLPLRAASLGFVRSEPRTLYFFIIDRPSTNLSVPTSDLNVCCCSMAQSSEIEREDENGQIRYMTLLPPLQIRSCVMIRVVVRVVLCLTGHDTVHWVSTAPLTTPWSGVVTLTLHGAGCGAVSAVRHDLEKESYINSNHQDYETMASFYPISHTIIITVYYPT
ncbi:hypothetical protein Scep_008108 [Stephania cephalantha]|uniref:Uncharacterized protein n=1 Tax=Stephania cephalantha TaxID=152367 RepID=A0AAP0PQN2_9MAGN